MRAESDRALQRANEELVELGPPPKVARDYRAEFDNIVHVGCTSEKYVEGLRTNVAFPFNRELLTGYIEVL